MTTLSRAIEPIGSDRPDNDKDAVDNAVCVIQFLARAWTLKETFAANKAETFC